jgi:hypothetical protein
MSEHWTTPEKQGSLQLQQAKHCPPAINATAHLVGAAQKGEAAWRWGIKHKEAMQRQQPLLK